MNTVSTQYTNEAPAPTSLGAKLLDLFVSPMLVFDEVAASPGRPANWLVPTALICLISQVFLNTVTDPQQIAAAIEELLGAGKITQEYATALSAHWQMISRGATCLESVVGVLWSGFVIWFIGRVFLKSRFSFSKA